MSDTPKKSLKAKGRTIVGRAGRSVCVWNERVMEEDSQRKYDVLANFYDSLGSPRTLLDQNITRLMNQDKSRAEAISILYENHRNEMQKSDERKSSEQQKIVDNKRNNVAFGIGLVMIALSLVLIVAPYVSTLGSNVILNETFVVPAYHYYRVGWTFTGDLSLHIRFDVEYGGDRSIDFYVVDQANLEKLEADESFNYYVEPSRVSISQMELDWIPPSDEPIYFVWVNKDILVPRNISAHFSFRQPMNFYSFFGVVLFFGGLSTSAYGNRPPSSTRTKIIAGYIFAALGGVIGLIIGFNLSRKDNSEEEKAHGKTILGIGILATISYVLLWFI